MFDLFSPIGQIRKISPRKAEKNISESYDYLANDFRQVALILENYHPLEVLKLSLWDERKVLSEKKKDSFLRSRAVLFPVLLQSVVQSTFFRGGGRERNILQKDWVRLLSLSDDALRRIVRIVENKTSLFLSSDSASDSDGEDYRRIIAEYLIPSEVTDASLRDSSDTLRSLLESRSDIEEKFAIQPQTLSINIENIARRGLNGIDDLCRRVQAYSSDYSLALAQMADTLTGKSEEEIYRAVTKKNGWEGRAESLAAERDGWDMFLVSQSTSLDSSVFDAFASDAGKLDLISFLKMGYWISMRYPIVRWNGEGYTFVAKHMPLFIALSSSFDRRNAAQKNVSAIFYRTGIDTYTYDGNNVDISVLPSFFDCNLFMKSASFLDIKRVREDETGLKTVYGHSRLIVDPDMREEMRHTDDALYISSLMMFRATIDRAKKKELISSLLGELVLPSGTEEYSGIDDDEIDNGEAPVYDDASDDTITDEYEYETDDGEDEEIVSPLPLVEYEKKNERNIAEEEEKYALTDEIIRRDEEIEKEEEKYESELDDDIFDDTEEEERLDEIGEKEESDYYEEIDGDESASDADEMTENTEGSDSADDDGQLDFFSLLDEEEEKVIDDELEKEDEEEFLREEEKEEELDGEDVPDESKECATGTLVEECGASENMETGELSSAVCDDASSDIISCDELSRLDGSDEETKSDDESWESSSIVKTEDEGNIVEETVESEDVPIDVEAPIPDEAEVISFDEAESGKDSEASKEGFSESDLDSAPEGNEGPEKETADENDISLEDEDGEALPSEELSRQDDRNDAFESSGNEETSGETESVADNEENEISAEEETHRDGEEREESGDEMNVPVDDEASVLSQDEQNAEPENKEPVTGEREEKKPLDVNSWMRDFLGDYQDEEDSSPEEETAPVSPVSEEDKALEIEDDSFVLPRDGRIEGKEEEISENEEAEAQIETTDGGEENNSPETEEKNHKSFAPSLLDGVETAEGAENEEEEKRQVLKMEELDEDESPLPLATDESAAEEEEIAADGIIYDIYKKLSPSSVFSSFVRSSDSETLEELESVIQSCWSRMQSEGRDKLFNVSDYSFSILLSKNNIRDDLRLAELFNNAGGVMYSRGEEKWTAIILYIDSDYILQGAIEKTITRASFSPSDWKRVTYIGEQMKKR